MPDTSAAPTTAEIKEVVQQVTQSQNLTTAFPGEFKLGDGTVVKANNWEEAFQKVADMKVNTAAALRDREAQIESLRQHPPTQQTATSTQSTNTGFDQKAYWELMNSDPVAAQNYLDAFRMGVDRPENVPLLFNEMRNVSTFSADNFEIQSFMQRNPDFPGTDEAADLLINKLAARNAPLTADNLEFEYLRGVRDGIIEPLGEEASRPFVPPNLQSASLGRDELSVLEQIRNTPDDKLDEMYRKLGLLK